MSFPRATGILLHPTSLPSHGGIGDLGPAAHEFINFLSLAKQGLWQVLPLGPPANGNSPYSSTSAFAGNPLLISLERLADYGWIDPASIASLPSASGPINYSEVIKTKIPLIIGAAQNFLQRADTNQKSRFEKFVTENEWWLEDYVLYDALREHHRKLAWKDWGSAIARREPHAMEQAKHDYESQIKVGRVIQFFFWEQWRALRRACAQKSIRIVGDTAIFVDYDSADVWANRDLFRIKDDLDPEVVSGVPPDAFSATGQRWGNPLYNWEKMRSHDYKWWVQRMSWATRTCDYIRLDHFRGFAQFWEIPAHEPTAINGKWVDGPSDDLFHKLREALGSLPFFAEDLGVITPDVNALRERLKIPRMAVLQFAFGNVGSHVYLPHRLTPDTVIYTGTHDNDTTVGWWKNAQPQERAAVESLVGHQEDGVNWALIRLAQSSVASLSVVPLQDVLGLGSEARLNIPSVSEGNYLWRYQASSLNSDLAKRLADLAEVTDRVCAPVQVSRDAASPDESIA
jgi:4-alpha-glucanotransferase